MRFTVDHDFHIHSQLSVCSRDPRQTPERIVSYAKEHGLRAVCLTDHFWDERVERLPFGWATDFYKEQNYPHICQAKPLPQEEGVTFFFGCEAEMDKNFKLGISKERIKDFDLVLIPTTHMHMRGFTLEEDEFCNAKRLAELWPQRVEAVLNMDLPFEKIGLAHLTCSLIGMTDGTYLKALDLIPTETMRRVFKKAASVGVGIELNADDMGYQDGEADVILRPYRIAKDCGCKFYYGGDAHRPEDFDKIENVEKAIDALGLEESDKFRLR